MRAERIFTVQDIIKMDVKINTENILSLIMFTEKYNFCECIHYTKHVHTYNYTVCSGQSKALQGKPKALFIPGL